MDQGQQSQSFIMDIPPEEAGAYYEGAKEIRFPDKRLVSQRFVEKRREEVLQTATKELYLYEKVVEVPQVIVKEVEKTVLRPHIMERIIENPVSWNFCGRRPIHDDTDTSGIFPNGMFSGSLAGGPLTSDDGPSPTMYGSGHFSGLGLGGPDGLPSDQPGGNVEYQEQLVEVPQIQIEEKIVYKPKKVIEERVFIVPKIEYVEKFEYEDVHEYREVPVDRIVELPPEIEYIVKEVEVPITQAYYQEQIVGSRYKEVPITQVQEVERNEYAAVASSSLSSVNHPPCPCCLREWPSQWSEGITAPVMA